MVVAVVVHRGWASLCFPGVEAIDITFFAEYPYARWMLLMVFTIK